MLEEYINAYNKAKEERNNAEIKRLQKELGSLGMDLMTLEVLSRELKK